MTKIRTLTMAQPVDIDNNMRHGTFLAEVMSSLRPSSFSRLF